MPCQIIHHFPMNRIVEGRCASVGALLCKNRVGYQPISFPIGSLVRIQVHQIHLEQVSVTTENSEVAALSAEEPEEF